jgi:hypothetical protein
MKNTVFWDVAPCRSCVNRRFEGTYRLHLQGKRIRERGTILSRWLVIGKSTANSYSGFSFLGFSVLRIV